MDIVDQRLDRLDTAVDKLGDKLDRVVESQGEIQADLREHMRRTQVAEGNIEKLALAMSPVQEHVAFIRGLGKLAVLLSALVGGLAAAWQILDK